MATATDEQISYETTLALGVHTAVVTVLDAVGNPAAVAWSFTNGHAPTDDPLAPTIGTLQPANGKVLTTGAGVVVSAAFSDGEGGSGIDTASVRLYLHHLGGQVSGHRYVTEVARR